ncbi:MAG: threonine--tRNA ligase [Propionibacteriaceae bacterium]|nr:threonine--tRNA ligase [Propionibacteriaceae bacterium]
MPIAIHLLQGSDQVTQVVDEGTTGLNLFGQDRSVVAMKCNGATVDLSMTLTEGDIIEPVLAVSDEGLSIIRHSAAHVTAQALQKLFPEANLGVGPPITDGFYYDFRTEPLNPEDLKAIEKTMMAIIKERQRFVRRVVSDEEALVEEASEPYKLELIADKGNANTEEGASVEVGGSELTIYDNVRRDGSVAWKDLCRGPHVPHTGYITAVALTKTSAAYWRGNQANDTLQRVYGTAWASKEDLVAYKTRLEEAAKRDHRKLGTQLDLFSFPEEIGSGLAVFHPKGGIIRMEMEQYSRQRHIEADYSFVNTPHITKGRLFEISQHLSWYEDAMYPSLHLDEEVDEQGVVRKAGQDYYLKPMNCPMHNLIYRSRQRSYRELPLRLFEFGTVYRYEKSGVVHGMLRARGFTQDDAHIYCTRSQMKQELTSLLSFVLDLLRDYGFDDFYLELSTKDPDKCVGPDEAWEEATETLRQVGEESGIALIPDPGGAAFYGPKISVQVKDAIGRTWQISTIQLDFNLPELFELEYTAEDGTHQRPVMIHRALFGSMERFFAVLTEHYAGAFPPWLSPVQVVGIPVAADFNDYLGNVLNQLKAAGVRVELDDSDDRMQKKIRNATQDKVPYMLIAGAEDQAKGAVSFRYRDGTQKNGVAIDDAIAEILTAIAERRPA